MEGAFAKLELRNNEMYFKGATEGGNGTTTEGSADTTTTTTTTTSTEAWDSLRTTLESYQPSLSAVIPSGDKATKLVQELTRKSTSLSHIDASSSFEVEDEAVMAMMEFDRVTEFLRHFFSFYDRRVRGLGGEEVGLKLEKLEKRIVEKGKELEKDRRRLLEVGRGKSELVVVLSTLQRQLDHALGLYDEMISAEQAAAKGKKRPASAVS